MFVMEWCHAFVWSISQRRACSPRGGCQGESRYRYVYHMSRYRFVAMRVDGQRDQSLMMESLNGLNII